MNQDIKTLISEIQVSMAASAKLCFEEPELSHLHYLVGITGEFMSYLETAGTVLPGSLTGARPSSKGGASLAEPPNSWNRAKGMRPPASGSSYDALTVGDTRLKYMVETVFNAVESFVSVNSAYRVLIGAVSSRIDWDTISVSSFYEQYASRFREFVTEPVFEKQCRLLLDLFKLELVFAGFSYD
jgi:hypothetical protein